LGECNVCRSAFRRDHHVIMGGIKSRLKPLLHRLDCVRRSDFNRDGIF